MAQTDNPFTFNYWWGTGGPSTQVAATWGDFKNASLWDYQNARNKGLIGGGGGGSPWGTVGATQPQKPKTTSADFGIQTIDLDPTGAAAVRSAVSKAGALIGADGKPLLGTQVRSPEQQRLIGAATSNWMRGTESARKNAAGARLTMEDFTKDYLGGDAVQKAMAAEESSAIAPIFTGGYESDLRRALNAFNLASDDSYQRAVSQLGRGVREQALLGKGEYGLARAEDAAVDLAIRRANERAAAEMGIPTAVANMQLAAMGRRAAADEASRRRALLSYDLQQQQLGLEQNLLNQELSQLGALQGVAMNNLYQEPYEAQLARQIALLGQAGQTRPLYSMLGYDAPSVNVPYPRMSPLMPAPGAMDYPVIIDASTGTMMESPYAEDQQYASYIPPGQMPMTSPERQNFEYQRSRFMWPEVWAQRGASAAVPSGRAQSLYTGWGGPNDAYYFVNGQLVPQAGQVDEPMVYSS